MGLARRQVQGKILMYLMCMNSYKVVKLADLASDPINNIWADELSISRERGVRWRMIEARTRIPGLPRIYHMVHLVDMPELYHMKYVMTTVMTYGRSMPLAFGDLKISQVGEAYDLEFFANNGCFGSRNETLPLTCRSWENCQSGVPFGEIRLGLDNPGGKRSLWVNPEFLNLGLEQEIIDTTRQIAMLLGARYIVPTSNTQQA